MVMLGWKTGGAGNLVERKLGVEVLEALGL